MKRLSFQILMFVICMIVSLVLFYVMEKQIYNRINIVNDKQAVLQRVNESLPIEVKVRHEKWGEIVVTDEVRLHTIVSFFDRIRIEPEGVKSQEQVFTGEVTYLNGHKRTFAVGDLFQYGENVYGHPYALLNTTQLKVNSDQAYPLLLPSLNNSSYKFALLHLTFLKNLLRYDTYSFLT